MYIYTDLFWLSTKFCLISYSKLWNFNYIFNDFLKIAKQLKNLGEYFNCTEKRETLSSPFRIWLLMVKSYSRPYWRHNWIFLSLGFSLYKIMPVIMFQQNSPKCLAQSQEQISYYNVTIYRWLSNSLYIGGTQSK